MLGLVERKGKYGTGGYNHTTEIAECLWIKLIQAAIGKKEFFPIQKIFFLFISGSEVFFFAFVYCSLGTTGGVKK
jgi:hypothetical protein